MTIDGARIYSENVKISDDCQEKIQQIIGVVKAVSPFSEVSMRFVKSGQTYEGLLWGKTDGYPIGLYNRGPSLSHVLETLHRRVKKECVKAWKHHEHQMLEMAG